MPHTHPLTHPSFLKFQGKRETQGKREKVRERERERKCFVEVGFLVTPSQPSSLHWFCGVYVFGGIATFVSLRQTPLPDFLDRESREGGWGRANRQGMPTQSPPSTDRHGRACQHIQNPLSDFMERESRAKDRRQKK